MGAQGIGAKRSRDLPPSGSVALEIDTDVIFAEKKRAMLQRRSIMRRNAVARRRPLEEKLASAEANRQQRLQAVVARAAERHSAVEARAASLKQRQGALAAQLESHLQQAEATRMARLAETSARAGQQFARVREAAAEHKLRSALDTAQRKQAALARLERAERHRREALQAMLAVVQAKHNGEGFLPREAARRELLRRRSSSRKLQAAWRAFCETRQTTRALAQAFVETGVPFTVPLEEQALGPQPQPSTASNQPAGATVTTPRGVSADPTPAGTPDPCSSPTSTVRRHDGRLSSAPVSIPQTPHTTPNRTPAASAAGSPTGGLARRGAQGEPGALPARTAGTPPAMPPLRSIAAPSTPPGLVEREPDAGTFERLAAALSTPATLTAGQALLQRLESRVSVKGVSAGCCAGLLRRIFPRTPPGRSLERYPPRIFLCAYMVLAHPDVVFNVRGEREAALTAAGRDMLVAFEALIARLAEPATSVRSGDASPAGAAASAAGTASNSASEQEEELGEAGEASAMSASLADMLQRFDEAWVAYLEQFVAWKSADAAGLETELIRVAVELERSRLAKVAGSSTPRARHLRSPEDLQAIANGVDHDLQLIAERVRRLTGAKGTARLDAALTAARAAAAAEQRDAAVAAAAATASDSEPESPPQAASVLGRSPSQSPIKKAPRSSGRFHTAGEDSSDGPPATVTPEVQSSLSRSSSGMSAGSSYGGAAAALSAAVNMDAALSQQGNLALMWHLLYDPQWQLPTAELDAAWEDALGHTDPMAEPAPSPEALAAAADPRQVAQLVQQRVKRIAEKAFWDSVQERLAGAGSVGGEAGAAASAVEQAAGLLAELGRQLAEVLPASVAADVAARLDGRQLAEQLLPSSGASMCAMLDIGALFGLLEWCGGLLAQYGAPARDAAAAAGQAAVRAQLAAAGGDVATTAGVAVRALRLLMVQLKTLRVDAANAHLRLLSVQLHSEGAATWAAGKFESMLGSPDSYADAEQLGAWLPHTRAWLAAASGQLPQVEQLSVLQAPGQSDAGTTGAGPSSQQQALPQLRSGLRAVASACASGAAATAAMQRLQLQTPVVARSWQGLVRLGLVQLVSGEGTIGRLPLPELLRLDAARLHTAQGDFQRLLVLTVCLLLVRQGSTASGRPFGPADMAGAKQRMLALLADPSMRLPDLAAEVARLSAAGDEGTEAAAARERAVQDSIHRMLSRSSGAMKALTSGITSALLALLLLGAGSSYAQEQAALALRRCGAADMACEAAELATQLADVAAVSEAVCGQWYRAIVADLM